MKKSKISTSEYSFTIIYEPVKKGGYHVTVPMLPGLITYGRNIEEAKKMAKDAIYCYLESLQKDNEPIPTEESLLQEKVAVSF